MWAASVLLTTIDNLPGAFFNADDAAMFHISFVRSLCNGLRWNSFEDESIIKTLPLNENIKTRSLQSYDRAVKFIYLDGILTVLEGNVMVERYIILL